MNIFEEYASRKGISYPIAHHTESSVLILKADRKKWDCNWCVLSVFWNADSHHPGLYKIYLKSPMRSLEPQGLSFLNNSHFFIEKSWFEYEKFFYEWNPTSKGLVPVFGNDAFLAAWEIFVCVNESYFLDQSLFLKNKLYETLNPTATAENRIRSCFDLSSSGSFSLSDVWRNKFLSIIESSYLNWFKVFTNYDHANL